jgi:1-acyl-sn-glycerol-3-phosphate acyltransferase
MKQRKNTSPNIIFLVLAYAVLFFPYRFYFRAKFIRDKQLLSKLGEDNRPVIIVFNHTSLLDIPSVGLCVGLPLLRKISFPAKKELFDHRLSRWLVPIMGIIPIDRSATDISAARSILAVLKEGRAVVISPEGTRGFSYDVQPLQIGFIKMAHKANALILPIGIHGAAKALPRNASFPKPHKLTLRVGDPIDIAEHLNSDGNNHNYEAVAEIIRQKMTELITVPER